MPDTAADAIRPCESGMPDTAADAIRPCESGMPDTAADAIRPCESGMPDMTGRYYPRLHRIYRRANMGSISSQTIGRARRRSEASQKVLCQAFFQESGLTAGKICTKMRFTATAGNSTPNTGVQRESGWCKLSRDAARRPPACRGQEMARRIPAVTGTRVRISQMRIQVEPRTKFFVRPEPFGLGATFYALSQTILMKKEFGT